MSLRNFTSGAPAMPLETDPQPSHRLSRRAMLRGLGVSMALPWMESMLSLIHI